MAQSSRSSRAASLVAALIGVAVVAVVAGCAPPAPPAPSRTGLPAGVGVALIQLRSDVASRQAEVEITNGTDGPLVVSAVSLDDPRFDGPATRAVERTSTIPAGVAVDVRVQLPAVSCPAPDDPRPTVTIHYRTADGEAVATAPIDDPLDFVAPLHERECRAAALAKAAAVSFTAFVPSDAGEPADLELTVAPTGAAATEITGIRTTNLLTFGQQAGDTADVWPVDAVVRPGDTAPIVVHLPLVPLRCDPHAVQEDKRGTIFDVEVVVDGEPGEIELPAGEEFRGRILTWVSQWCGFGG